VANLCPDRECFGAGPVYLTSRETGQAVLTPAKPDEVNPDVGGQKLKSSLGAQTLSETKLRADK